MALSNQRVNTSNGPALAEIVTMLAERCKTLKEMQTSGISLKILNNFDESAVKKHLKITAIEALCKVKKNTAVSSWNLQNTHQLSKIQPKN